MIIFGINLYSEAHANLAEAEESMNNAQEEEEEGEEGGQEDSQGDESQVDDSITIGKCSVLWFARRLRCYRF